MDISGNRLTSPVLRILRHSMGIASIAVAALHISVTGGCAHCLRVFEFPEIHIDGKLLDGDGRPVTDEPLRLVLVRGIGHRNALQDEAEQGIADDSPAYMTTEAQDAEWYAIQLWPEKAHAHLVVKKTGKLVGIDKSKQIVSIGADADFEGRQTTISLSCVTK